MDKITDDVKKVLEKIQWGSVATASKGGVPNVSPKGSFKIVDEQTIRFADIFSEHTRKNLMENPRVAIDIVDAETASGYQLKGTATLADSGPLFDAAKEEGAFKGGRLFPCMVQRMSCHISHCGWKLMTEIKDGWKGHQQWQRGLQIVCGH